MGRLIALSGRAGSGKNTVADMLGGKQFSFAEPLKRICKEVFDFTDAQLYGPSEERNRLDLRYPRECLRCDGQGATWDGTCPVCGGAGETFLTARYALQTLGTEWGRTCYQDVWAELGVRKALERAVRCGRHPDPADTARVNFEDPCTCAGDLAVLTDCRFTNEAQAVRAAGGEVWRIVRPGASLAGAAALHPSEAEQESPEFLSLVNLTIDNSGTLEDLRTRVSYGLLPAW